MQIEVKVWMVIRILYHSVSLCFFSSLICDSTTQVWVIWILSALIVSSFAMNFNSLIYGNLFHMVLSRSIFALLMNYIECKVFTYFIIGLKAETGLSYG